MALSPPVVDRLEQAFSYRSKAKHRKADDRGGKGKLHIATPRAVFGGGSNADRSRAAVQALARTANRAPEVVVKITGKQRNGAHAFANFSYIARAGRRGVEKLELEDQDGNLLKGKRDLTRTAEKWEAWENADEARRKGAISRSIILSYPEKADAQKVKDAARAFAQDQFGNHRWVMALHTDTDHPHVHLTVAVKNNDGRRTYPTREDLFQYRLAFAEKLRERGLEANATPRKVRGIADKPDRTGTHQLKKSGHTPDFGTKSAARGKPGASEGNKGVRIATVLKEQRAAVLAVFSQSITELKASADPGHHMISHSLERFVDTMPALPRFDQAGKVEARSAKVVEDPLQKVLDELRNDREERQARIKISTELRGLLELGADRSTADKLKQQIERLKEQRNANQREDGSGNRVADRAGDRIRERIAERKKEGPKRE